MKNRKSRHPSKSSHAIWNRMEWHGVFLLTISLASFIWFILPQMHIPGYLSNPYVYMCDWYAHSPKFILFFGFIVFLLGSLKTWSLYKIRRIRVDLFNRQLAKRSLHGLSWQEFELITGEYFRRQGYQILETGQGGADGGIDLILMGKHGKVLVQCKQWKSTSVGAKVVREMMGLLQHHKASKVIVVSSGKFTKDAAAFAIGKPIELISGEQLNELLANMSRS